MASRITINPSTNGTSKPATPRKATPTTSKPRKPVVHKTDELVRWSHIGIITTALLSAGLNAYANFQTASIPWLGAAIGVSIPWLIYILCKVGGEQNARGHVKRARFTGVAALALLGLSIHHCARSIALLTCGTSDLTWEHWAMAIAIDAGLVACELATIKVK